MTQDELIDESSIESFPASDPPSHWARDPYENGSSSEAEGDDSGDEAPETI